MSSSSLLIDDDDLIGVSRAGHMGEARGEADVEDDDDDNDEVDFVVDRRRLLKLSLRLLFENHLLDLETK